MILSFGMSICGLRSGTQNWQRRPHPVVISTTPNVVRLSGKRISSRSFGCTTSTCFGRSSPASALSNSFRTSADSLRPSTTQSTLSASQELVCVICQPPEPPTMTLKFLRLRVRLDGREQLHRVVRVDRLLRRPEDRRVDAGGKRHAQRVVCRDGDDARVGPDELVEVGGVAARDVALPGSAAAARLRARGRRPACIGPSRPRCTPRCARCGYFRLRMPSSHMGSEAMLI